MTQTLSVLPGGEDKPESSMDSHQFYSSIFSFAVRRQILLDFPNSYSILSLGLYDQKNLELVLIK